MLIRRTAFWDPKKYPRLTTKLQDATRGDFNRFLCEAAEEKLIRLEDEPPVDELQDIREGIRQIQKSLADLANNGVISKQAEKDVLESVKTKLAVKKLVC